MAGATWAEDEIGRKWDRCFTDAIIKLGNYFLQKFPSKFNDLLSRTFMILIDVLTFYRRRHCHWIRSLSAIF